MQGKQAKVLSPTQERAIVGYLDTPRYPMRDRVIFLLSIKAGLRAKEIASLTWAMVTDAEGQIAEVISLQNRASKGKTGGRTIPIHPEVSTALVTLQTWRGDAVGPDRPLIFSARGGGLSPATVRLWCHRLYTSLKMDGCSSHSGRRTFITRAARKVSQVGGSLRDVQGLAGHTSLAMTQRYIEGDMEAKRKLVALISSNLGRQSRPSMTRARPAYRTRHPGSFPAERTELADMQVPSAGKGVAMETLIVDAEGKVTIPSEVLHKRGLRPGDAVALVESAEGLLVYQGGVEPQTLAWWQALSDEDKQRAAAEAHHYEARTDAERDAIWNEGTETLDADAEDDERELPAP